MFGSNAEPGWDKFVEKYADSFIISADSQKIIDLNPHWTSPALVDMHKTACHITKMLGI